MMVSMAGLQVFVVRFFFQGARKGVYFFVVLRFWMNRADWLCRLCVTRTYELFYGVYIGVVSLCLFMHPSFQHSICV
jgi:hypothetical protein